MAITVTPTDTARHLRRMEERRAAAGAARARRLRAHLPEAASLLRTEYGAERVILFGSLAVGGWHAGSDLDLAVSGLAPDRYFAALGALMGLLGTAVDLVTLETAPPSLRARIEADGEPL